MRVIFRADASNMIGTGHVMRCLTLASALRQAGASASFVCREHQGHLCDLIERNGFAVSRLPVSAVDRAVGDTLAHGAWLGSAWQEDAAQTRDVISCIGKPEWLVVDHYALDARWEAATRDSVGRILAIDDIADRPHDCDLLLDQNLFEEMQARYTHRVPAGCGQLLGPAYALLQPDYERLHHQIPPRQGPIRRILIFFGGADAADMTGRTVASWLDVGRPEVDVDVVVTANLRYLGELRRRIDGHGNIHMHHALPTLAPLMARADLAIGASGATSWERLCLGLPSVVISVAENQRGIAEELGRRGLIRYVGQSGTVSDAAIREVLAELSSAELDDAWSKRCSAAVDGLGARRVCVALMAGRDTPLHARHAKWVERSALWSPDDLRDPDARSLYVVETADGVAVGATRFDHEASECNVSYDVDPPFRHRALERPVLAAALSDLRGSRQGVLTLRQPERPQMATSGRTTDEKRCGSASLPLKISVCSDAESWINRALPDLLFDWLAAGHLVSWSHDAVDLPTGDVCFFLGYSRIVPPDVLRRYANNLVVHESDLPRGRGWSPLTWQILEGKNAIPVTLFEVAAKVDSGSIYLQDVIDFTGQELVEDLRRLQSAVTFNLCRRFILEYPGVVAGGRVQTGSPTYYRRRGAADAELDLNRPLRHYTNLLRVSDNDRYPAWFRLNGRVVTLRVEG